MEHDAQSGPTLVDFGGARQIAAKQRTAIRHEVNRLLDDLAPEKPPPRREGLEQAVKCYRWPNRCILQGESRAISVSWFPGDRDDTFGELMVIAWDGQVALPGSARRVREEAVARTQLLLHLEETAAGGWTWRAEEDDATPLGTTALAAYCREQLAS